MRRPLIALLTIGSFLALGHSAVGAPNKAPRLICFSGGGATCSVDNGNAATLDVPGGGFAGVYVNGKSYSNKALSAVSFSFTYWGDVSGGTPRLSIPINDGTTPTPYAFIDAAGCGYVTDVAPNTSHEVGTSSGCKVNFKGTDYANWAAFAAANPTLRISNGTQAFVIADQPGHVVIYSVSTN